MTIKIVKVPGGVSEIDLTIEGATVKDVKELIGLTENQEVRVNGDKVEDDTLLEDGDMVSAAAKIKGA